MGDHDDEVAEHVADWKLLRTDLAGGGGTIQLTHLDNRAASSTAVREEMPR
jgi:hypothetical protein